jgi:hypothetical protein
MGEVGPVDNTARDPNNPACSRAAPSAGVAGFAPAAEGALL